MILLISPKNTYATNRILLEAKSAGQNIDHFTAAELAKMNFDINIDKYDILYVRFPWPYFNEIINLAAKFYKLGKKVVDKCIVFGDIDHDKYTMYEKLLSAGVSMPKTSVFSGRKKDRLKFPFILKWNFGQKGKNVFLVKSDLEVFKVLTKYKEQELLVQDFIEAEYEYKVITVGFKSLPVVIKFPINIKTKRPIMEKFKILNSSDPQISNLILLSEKAAQVCKRELAKVDVLEKGGKFFVLEVNRWPGFKSFEKITNFNVAKEFINYLRLKK